MLLPTRWLLFLVACATMSAAPPRTLLYGNFDAANPPGTCAATWTGASRFAGKYIPGRIGLGVQMNGPAVASCGSNGIFDPRRGSVAFWILLQKPDAPWEILSTYPNFPRVSVRGQTNIATSGGFPYSSVQVADGVVYVNWQAHGRAVGDKVWLRGFSYGPLNGQYVITQADASRISFGYSAGLMDGTYTGGRVFVPGSFGALVSFGQLNSSVYDYSENANIAADLPTGSWTHVVWTWQGARHTFYVNGVLAGSFQAQSAMPVNQVSPFRWGNSTYGTGQDVIVDEFGIYSFPLTSAEVSSLYTNAGGGPAVPSASHGLDAVVRWGWVGGLLEVHADAGNDYAGTAQYFHIDVMNAGAVVAKGDLAVGVDGFAAGTVAMGELPSGTYWAVVSARDTSGQPLGTLTTNPIVYAKPTYVDHQLGKQPGEVQSGFNSVSSSGYRISNGYWSYFFSRGYGLPTQAVSLERALFTKAPQLTISQSGNPVTLINPWVLLTRNDISGAAWIGGACTGVGSTCDPSGVTVAISGTMEPDGYCLISLTFRPTGGQASVSSIVLSSSTPAAQAQYVTTEPNVFKGRVPLTPGLVFATQSLIGAYSANQNAGSRLIHTITLSDNERGLVWFSPDLSGWRIDEGQPLQTLTREVNGDVTMQHNLVNTAVTWTGAITVRVGFIIGPMRGADPSWRSGRFGTSTNQAIPTTFQARWHFGTDEQCSPSGSTALGMANLVGSNRFTNSNPAIPQGASVSLVMSGTGARPPEPLSKLFALDLVTNQLSLVGHGIQEGQSLRLTSVGSGGLPISLSAATTYYAVNVGPSRLQLSLSRGGAALSLAGSATQLYVFSAAQDYFVVNRTSTDLQLSLIPAGTPIAFTGTGSGSASLRLVSHSTSSFVIPSLGENLPTFSLSPQVPAAWTPYADCIRAGGGAFPWRFAQFVNSHAMYYSYTLRNGELNNTFADEVSPFQNYYYQPSEAALRYWLYGVDQFLAGNGFDTIYIDETYAHAYSRSLAAGTGYVKSSSYAGSDFSGTLGSAFPQLGIRNQLKWTRSLMLNRAGNAKTSPAVWLHTSRHGLPQVWAFADLVSHGESMPLYRQIPSGNGVQAPASLALAGITVTGGSVSVALPGHGLAAGDAVKISGANTAGLNGNYSVAVSGLTANTFMLNGPMTAPTGFYSNVTDSGLQLLDSNNNVIGVFVTISIDGAGLATVSWKNHSLCPANNCTSDPVRISIRGSSASGLNGDWNLNTFQSADTFSFTTGLPTLQGIYGAATDSGLTIFPQDFTTLLGENLLDETQATGRGAEVMAQIRTTKWGLPQVFLKYLYGPPGGTGAYLSQERKLLTMALLLDFLTVDPPAWFGQVKWDTQIAMAGTSFVGYWNNTALQVTGMGSSQVRVSYYKTPAGVAAVVANLGEDFSGQLAINVAALGRPGGSFTATDMSCRGNRVPCLAYSPVTVSSNNSMPIFVPRHDMTILLLQ